ncbi:MAG TPA: hypothetical protein VF590_25960 [Isosphaeraceae bacterium]
MLTVRVCNLTGGALRVYGLRGFCGRDGCLSTDEAFPRSIGPWGVRELTIRVTAAEVPTDPWRLVSEVYTDAGEHEIFVVGRVEGAQTAGAITGREAEQ